MTLTRKKPMRKVSSKRAKQNREYTQRRKLFLAFHEFCDCCLEKGIAMLATEIHHRAGRIGDNLNDERDWMAVCKSLHNWIHAHGKEARKKGRLL